MNREQSWSSENQRRRQSDMSSSSRERWKWETFIYSSISSASSCDQLGGILHRHRCRGGAGTRAPSLNLKTTRLGEYMNIAMNVKTPLVLMNQNNVVIDHCLSHWNAFLSLYSINPLTSAPLDTAKSKSSVTVLNGLKKCPLSSEPWVMTLTLRLSDIKNLKFHLSHFWKTEKCPSSDSAGWFQPRVRASELLHPLMVQYHCR